MHIAIAVGTLMLGGWVLDASSENDATAVQAPAPSAATATQSAMPPVLPNRSGTGMDRGQGRTPYGGGPTMGNRTTAQGGQAGRAPQQPMQQMMPSAPTEGMSAGDDGMMGQPSAPTASQSFSGPSSGGAGRSPAGYGPMAPTARRPMASQTGRRSMMPGGMAAGRTSPMVSGSAALMAPPVDKAFSGYRPTSGVSPYMNIFRRDSDGTIDNYTSLVRPEVEQRFLNNQFGRDIHGLERNTRTQGMNLQHMNQQQRELQGVGTPQFYMNYGTYFPSGQ